MEAGPNARGEGPTVVTPAEFINGCPCLEEIDGYLHRFDVGVDENGNPRPGQHQMTTEDFRLIEDYRRKLMKGKVLPYETKLKRGYRYIRNRKPLKLRVPE